MDEKVSTTISQTGLALRFGWSAGRVRRNGMCVVGRARDGYDETWVREEYSNGRLAGYKRVTRSRS